MEIYNLPNEIKLHIVSYMDINTCRKMSQVNKQWNNIIKSFFTTFFIKLLWNDFTIYSENPIEEYLHMWLFKYNYCTLKNHSHYYIYKHKIFWSIRFIRFIIELFNITVNRFVMEKKLMFHEYYENIDPWYFEDEIILILKCIIHINIPIECILHEIEQNHLLFTLV